MDLSPFSTGRREGRWKQAGKRGEDADASPSIPSHPLIDVPPPPLPKRSRSIMSCRSKDFPPPFPSLPFLLHLRHHHRGSDQASKHWSRFRGTFLVLPQGSEHQRRCVTSRTPHKYAMRNETIFSQANSIFRGLAIIATTVTPPAAALR